MENMNHMIMRDSPIGFPGLFGDWTFTASSKALDIGHGVYWYGLILTLGVILAAIFCLKQKEKYGITEDNLLDAILWGVPCGVIGARIYYVLFYLDVYKTHLGGFDWKGAIAIWDGGLAIYGAVIAAIIVCILLAKKEGFKVFAMTDLIVMGLLIGQTVGRWGNFMNREAFGTTTTLPWRMQLTTIYGQQINVHPTFLYESLWNLIGLLLIVFIVARGRRFDGENTWFYFLWYGIGRFWVEGLRTDSLYLFDWKFMGNPIRVSQALSLVMILAAAFMLFYHIKLHPHAPEELWVNQVAAKAAAAEDAEVTGDAAEEAGEDEAAGESAAEETGEETAAAEEEKTEE